MVKLYTSHSDFASLSILVTSLAVGIPNLECFITSTLPNKIVNENFEAFHVSLPLLNIDKRNNVSTTNAILLYLASLQEKLQLVTGVETIEYLDLVQQTDDATFVELIQSKVEKDSFLQKRDTWTLADVAVYPRLKSLNVSCANVQAYIDFVSKDKFFQEGEIRFNKLLDEAVSQTVSLLNSGKLWELTKEEQAGALQILVQHYKDILPGIEQKDDEKRAKLGNDAKDGEVAIKGITSDLEAYKKVIAMYEQSLKALNNA